jgi:HPt (histidine-containing phosphotransfer) domain-containing protein
MGQASDRLARQSDRLQRYLESIPPRVDALVKAAMANDRETMRRIGSFLATSSVVFGLTNLSEAAQNFCQELNRSSDNLGIKRSLVKLIARCGAKSTAEA